MSLPWRAPAYAGRRLLLDVNVWTALMDSVHVHHSRAFALFTDPGIRIASCAITQSGVIRLAALPAAHPNGCATPSQARDVLLRVVSSLDHEYWPCEPSPLADDIIDWKRVSGHRQITDCYLLALAVSQNATLVSLDQRIALHSVKGARPHHYLVI